jgi:hypothetical protein
MRISNLQTTQASPLQQLELIDRLEVGPLRMEPRRLIAPYTVHQNGAVDRSDFTLESPAIFTALYHVGVDDRKAAQFQTEC